MFSKESHIQPTNLTVPFHFPLGGGLSNQCKQGLKILIWPENKDLQGFLVC